MSHDEAKERSRATFDRLAPRYEETVAGLHSSEMKRAALGCLGGALRGALLDVGCGPGLLLEMLAEREGTLALAGVDISAEMVRVAAVRLRGRADVRVGDAEALPWEDRRFDYVVCVDSFHHYPRPDRALAEMRRVLRSDGRLVIADPTAPAVLRGSVNAVIRLFGRGDVKIYGRGEFEAMLAGRGFQRFAWTRVGAWGFVATALAP